MKRILLTAGLIISGIFLSCSREEPFVEPEPPLPTVLINEVYSRGDSINADWIEIYNPTGTPVDLSGFKVYDSGGQSGSKPKKEFPSGSIVPVNGFLTIVVDDTMESGFGLSSSGETIWLENPSGNVIDNVAFPELGIDTSFARNPNGSSNWVQLYPYTKGVSNGLDPLVMNEIYSRGVAGNLDWIEIYNPNTEAIELTGYKIYDTGGNSGGKPKKVFPEGSIVPAGGFYVIVTDTADFEGDLSGFGLSSSGETVWFENASGTVIDNYAFLAMDITQSFSRIPDGSANWLLSNTITRGIQNQP